MRGLVGGGWRSGWAEGAREARGGAAQRGRPLSLPPHSPHPTPPPPKGVVGSRTERAQHRPRRLKAAAREEERVQVHEAREHEALALVECVEGVYVVCFVCEGESMFGSLSVLDRTGDGDGPPTLQRASSYAAPPATPSATHTARTPHTQTPPNAPCPAPRRRGPRACAPRPSP